MKINDTNINCFLFPLFLKKKKQVYPEKYCKLVEQEHGVKLLMDLMDHMETCEKLKELAQIVLTNIDQNNQKYMEE